MCMTAPKIPPPPATPPPPPKFDAALLFGAARNRNDPRIRTGFAGTRLTGPAGLSPAANTRQAQLFGQVGF